MRKLIDYFKMLNPDELKDLLGYIVDDEEVGLQRTRVFWPDKLNRIFFTELSKAANLNSKISEENDILRCSLELLMKKHKIPFTSNLDDEALFRLFRRFIGEKILEHLRPLLLAGYFMARCDNNFQHDEKEILTFFIKNLDVLDEVKNDFLNSFFTEAEQVYNQYKETEDFRVLTKACKTKDDEKNQHILRFCYAIAMVDEEVKRDELIFHDILAREFSIDPAEVYEIRDEVEEANKRVRDAKKLGEDLGCKNYNGLVVHATISEIGTTILKGAGVVFLSGLIGFAIYGTYKIFTFVDYSKLNVMLTSIAIKAEEDFKEERIIEVRTIFEKLAKETGDMLFLCKNIHFYLENINKTYNEVADQAWIKGLLQQVSSKNREKLTAGGMLLRTAVEDVSMLLGKIIEHQQTISIAIDEHLRLISLSEELQKEVRELVRQNKRLVEIVQEADKAGIKIAV